MAKSFVYRILCGFFLGISILAPGFSGSIVAITMGIYEDLIRIFSNPFKDFKKNVIFALPLAIGMMVSAVLFVLLFRYLFEHYLKVTYFLFVGLIAGNLPFITRTIRTHGFRAHDGLGVAAAFAAALVLGMSPDAAALQENAVTASIYELAAGGFVVGAVGFIPGMSVTTILISMGVYGQLILMAETSLGLDFVFVAPLVVFFAAAGLGLMLTSKGIKFLFEKFPGFANSAVLGFIAGSLTAIFLQALQMPDVNFSWGAGAAALTVGLLCSIWFVNAVSAKR